jgi:hypothetical protein
MRNALPVIKRAVLVPALLGGALVLPASAVGQEPGVHFDEGPAKKEYAVPLQEGRSGSNPGPGGGDAGGGGGGFGSGTGPGGISGSSAGFSLSDKVSPGTPTAGLSDKVAENVAGSEKATDHRLAKGSGDGGGLPLAGVAALVLVGGGGLGYAMRRRREALG